MHKRKHLVRWVVGCWTENPGWFWLERAAGKGKQGRLAGLGGQERMVGLDGLWQMGFQHLLKCHHQLTNSSIFESSSLQRFLLRLHTSADEPRGNMRNRNFSWRKRDRDGVNYQSFIINGEVVIIKSWVSKSDCFLHDTLAKDLEMGIGQTSGSKPGKEEEEDFDFLSLFISCCCFIIVDLHYKRSFVRRPWSTIVSLQIKWARLTSTGNTQFMRETSAGLIFLSVAFVRGSHCTVFTNCQLYSLEVNYSELNNQTCNTTTPSGGEGVASLAFLSHMSSPTSHLRGQSQAMPKILCYMKRTGLFS